MSIAASPSRARLIEVGQPGEGTARHEERLVRPLGPEGHDREPLAILVHDPWPTRLLLGVVGEQSPPVRAVEASLPRVFLRRLAGHGPTGPDLAMGMRIRCPHGGPAVLEHLDPAVESTELGRLVTPDVDDSAYLRLPELPQVDVMAWGVAEDPAGPRLGFGAQQPGPIRRRIVRWRERWEVVGEDEGARVRRVASPAGSRVARAQVARAVERGPCVDLRWLAGAEPWPRVPSCGNEDPLARQRVVASVRRPGWPVRHADRPPAMVSSAPAPSTARTTQTVGSRPVRSG